MSEPFSYSEVKPLRGRAIVKFLHEDIKRAYVSDGGIEIAAFTGSRDVYYTPQICILQSINDKDSKLKQGDRILVSYEVYVAGHGGQDKYNNRVIESDDEGVVMWCNVKDILAKIEGEELIPEQDYFFGELMHDKIESKTIIILNTNDTDKVAMRFKVKYLSEKIKLETRLKEGEDVWCDKLADNNLNRIPMNGKAVWLYAVSYSDILGTFA